jgi:uncharacterized protein (TIGR04255 family)
MDCLSIETKPRAVYLLENIMTMFKADKKKVETPAMINPPLVEAIYELRWEMETDQQTGRMRDPSYPMMVGRMYERLKKDFPIAEDLPSVQAHPEATPYMPRHRMRKQKEGYPLVQIGPGILTMNDNQGYSWDNFKEIVVRLVETIIDLFPSGSIPLNFVKSELRYVNGIRFDLAKENPLAFLAEKLHMKVELDPALNDQVSIAGKPNSIGLNLAYALENPLGHLGISANMGQVDGKPAFIQQTVIQSFGELVPTEVSAFETWLEEAHTTAESCFQVFTKGPLMNKFCGN